MSNKDTGITLPLPANAVLFAKLFEAAIEIPYNPEWANGTGYFDGILDRDAALTVEDSAKIYKFTETSTKRRGLVITTPHGLFCVFERYTDRPDVFGFHCNRLFEVMGVVRNKALDEEDLSNIFGDTHGLQPIGRRMEGAIAYNARRNKLFDEFDALQGKPA